MKVLITIACFLLASSGPADETPALIAFSHTVSDAAAIGPDAPLPDVYDHFGDLTRTQYIIAVPPVHA